VCSSSAGAHRVSIKALGSTTAVPDNKFARLMYYLGCVESISTISFGKYTKYRDYYSLSNEDLAFVVKLALAFSPDKLREIGVFVEVSDDTMDSGNEFFEIEQQSFVALADDDIAIGAFRGKVNKIMAYKKSWLEKNYLAPLAAIILMAELASKRQITYENPRRVTKKSSSDVDCYCGGCLLL
jgi:hypothetical protein